MTAASHDPSSQNLPPHNPPPHSPPPLGQVLESALYVDDLDRAAVFYGHVLGLRPLVADGRFRAYAAGDRNVLLLFQRGATSETVHLPGGVIPPHGYLKNRPDDRIQQHIAFAVSREGLGLWEKALEARGVAIEGRTDWPKGGHSIYFRDTDGHLLELATPGLWPISGG